MTLTVRGDTRVPPDKSITHRALIVAALARGESVIRTPLDAADTRSTAEALRRLGCRLPELVRGEVTLRSPGCAGWTPARGRLDCGNSGTTARLLLGCLAGAGVEATLDGDASLRGRPMARVTQPLEGAGARFRYLEQAGRLPLEVAGGRLAPFAHVSSVASAQVKSALLLAAVAGGVPVRVSEPVPSRDHTERLLRHLGVHVGAGWGAEGWELSLADPPGELSPFELTVPGDPSSAAGRLALALLADAGELTLRGVLANPTRLGFVELLRRMGAEIEVEMEEGGGPEPTATLIARPSRLRGVQVGAEEVPAAIDELVLLGALGARAEGETVVRGAAELRLKESDRIAALVANLRGIGAQAEESPDGFTVLGSDAPLRGRVTTHGDHRVALAFGVLGALPGNRIEIDDPGCVAVSDPAFWEELKLLTTG